MAAPESTPAGKVKRPSDVGLKDSSLRKSAMDVSNFTVLIVDDEPTTRKILMHFLQKAGYAKVEAASSGQEALQMIKDAPKPFHLVICDINMPGMSGLEVLKALKDDAATKDIPVIMMSATEDLDLVFRCLEKGADYYLLKPLKREMIANLWQNVSRKRRENASMHQLEKEIASLKGQVSQAIETPVSIIIKTIQDIMKAQQLTPEVHAALLTVLKSLSSSDLHKPLIDRMIDDTDGLTRFYLTTDLQLDRLQGLSPLSGTSSSPSISALNNNALSQSNSSNAVQQQSSTVSSVSFAPATADQMAPFQKAEILEKLKTWDFNVWSYSEDDLVAFVPAILIDCGCVEKFKVPIAALLGFAKEVKLNYRQNPYHNFRHAFEVFHGVYFFLSQCNAKEILSPMEAFAALIAAYCHDLDHPGVNNTFHILTNSPLALQYNDKAVLENYHCAKAFNIMRKSENNIIRNLSQTEYREFRSVVINTILSTDMGVHLEVIGRVSACANNFQKENKDHRALLIQTMMKAADLGNTARPFAVSRYWADLVREEFFFQGDQEKEMNLPISPFMDRENSAPLPKTQTGFIDFVVQPLYSHLKTLLPSSSVCLDTLQTNRQRWQNIIDHQEPSEEDE